METRKTNGQKWVDWYGSKSYELQPATPPRKVIVYYPGSFEAWCYRYPNSDGRNCIGGFRTFKQAAAALAGPQPRPAKVPRL